MNTFHDSAVGQQLAHDAAAHMSMCSPERAAARIGESRQTPRSSQGSALAVQIKIQVQAKGVRLSNSNSTDEVSIAQLQHHAASSLISADGRTAADLDRALKVRPLRLRLAHGAGGHETLTRQHAVFLRRAGRSRANKGRRPIKCSAGRSRAGRRPIKCSSAQSGDQSPCPPCIWPQKQENCVGLRAGCADARRPLFHRAAPQPHVGVPRVRPVSLHIRY